MRIKYLFFVYSNEGVGSASRSKHVSFSAEKGDIRCHWTKLIRVNNPQLTELPSESADYGFDDNNRFEDEENEQEAEERGKLKDRYILPVDSSN